MRRSSCSPSRCECAAAGNLLFTVATVIVVLVGVWPLTTTGVALFLGTGVYTLVMAELQFQGVRRISARG